MNDIIVKNKIATDLPSGGLSEIKAEELRGVLDTMVDYTTDVLNVVDNIDDKGILNASTGVATIASGNVTLTATPPTDWISGQSVTVQTVGNIGFGGVNFTSGTTLNIGDKLRKRNTQWELLKFSIGDYIITEQKISKDAKVIKSWEARAYLANAQVLYTNGNMYYANTNTLSTDIPSISTKWSIVLTNYDNRINLNESNFDTLQKRTVGEYVEKPVIGATTRWNFTNTVLSEGNIVANVGLNRTINWTGQTDTTGSEASDVSYKDTGILATGRLGNTVIFSATIGTIRTSSPYLGIGWDNGTDKVSILLRSTGVISSYVKGIGYTDYQTSTTGQSYSTGDTITIEAKIESTGVTFRCAKNGIFSSYYTFPKAVQGNFYIVNRGSLDFTSGKILYNTYAEIQNNQDNFDSLQRRVLGEYVEKPISGNTNRWDYQNTVLSDGNIAVNIGIDRLISWTGQTDSTILSDVSYKNTGIVATGRTNNTIVFSAVIGTLRTTTPYIGIGWDNGTDKVSVLLRSTGMISAYIKGIGQTDYQTATTAQEFTTGDTVTLELKIISTGVTFRCAKNGVFSPYYSLSKVVQGNFYIVNRGSLDFTNGKFLYKTYSEIQQNIDSSLVLAKSYADAQDNILKDQINILPNVFYSINTTGYSGALLMYVYVKYSTLSKYYIGYQVVNDYSVVDRKDVYRIIGADLYRFDGTNMVSQSKPLLTGGENEFAFRQQGKTDYTGGYYGDEKQTSIRFFVNGMLLYTGSNVSLTPANELMYIQKSNMYETDNVIDTIIATHQKRTTFSLGGYKTENRLTGIASSILLDITNFGIVSISREQSELFFDENYIYITANSDNTEKLNDVGAREVNYYSSSNKLGAKVYSEITKPSSYDTDSVMIVWDSSSSNYRKYYRRTINKTLTSGTTWEGYTIVKHSENL